MMTSMRHAAAALAVAAALAAGPSAPAAADVTLDVAIFHSETDLFNHAYAWWAGEVEKRTEGRVKFKPHYRGSLIALPQAFPATRDGVVPMATAGASFMTGEFPALGFIGAMAGMPNDPDNSIAVVRKLQPVLESMFRDKGVEFLWMQPGPGLAVACRKDHLKTPADWKGKKVRGAGRWQSLQLRTLGASPIAMPPAEQYVALQQGTVDCGLFLHNLVLSFRTYEVAPKVTSLNVTVNALMYLANADAWKRISEADRKVIHGLSAEAMARGTRYLFAEQKAAADEIKTKGADVYALNDKEHAAFKAALRPIFDQIAEAAGAQGKPFVETLKPYW